MNNNVSVIDLSPSTFEGSGTSISERSVSLELVMVSPDTQIQISSLISDFVAGLSWWDSREGRSIKQI